MAIPKISVIVPVYKAEAYLHRCVDSILAQTFKDIEVLLINDGSPDRSGEICDEYSHEDSRIRVFHKENGGVSSARQCGLDNAIGEYVIHVDPDDWIEKDMYERMYNVAQCNGADMVICDIHIDGTTKTFLASQNFEELDHIYILKQMYHYMCGSCCNKLVRRSCFSQYNIRFPSELFYGEDLYVNTCLLSNSIKIAYIPTALYHYDQVVNENSLVRKPLGRLFAQSKLLCKLLKQRIPDNVYNGIEFYLLYQQAIVALRLGYPYIKDFRAEYKSLIAHIGSINPPFKEKLLLLLAINISAPLSHSIIIIYRVIKRWCHIDL